VRTSHLHCKWPRIVRAVVTDACARHRVSAYVCLHEARASADRPDLPGRRSARLIDNGGSADRPVPRTDRYCLDAPTREHVHLGEARRWTRDRVRIVEGSFPEAHYSEVQSLNVQCVEALLLHNYTVFGDYSLPGNLAKSQPERPPMDDPPMRILPGEKRPAAVSRKLPGFGFLRSQGRTRTSYSHVRALGVAQGAGNSPRRASRRRKAGPEGTLTRPLKPARKGDSLHGDVDDRGPPGWPPVALSAGAESTGTDSAGRSRPTDADSRGPGFRSIAFYPLPLRPRSCRTWVSQNAAKS
jgi:hypothetical protein